MNLQQYKDLVGELLAKHYARLQGEAGLTDMALRAAMTDGVQAYELVNQHAQAKHLRRVDLDSRNAFPHARLSNVDQYRATQRLSLKSLCTAVRDASQDAPGALVVYSRQESHNAGAGFWSNSCGWVALQDATRFTEDEARSRALPMSAGNDAQWIAAADAQDAIGVVV
ncbi:hypothetical protein [Noviherbaspirillum pedocola]|uniref:hypothetical protein n=1 Tax=Noviherbaspirillum pedocola TaxID=2801341 RepID=UPI001F35947D|nr:hypothetical protein [Noviherbaspirillum pedocola]